MARPREFDEDEVIDLVTHLFWQKGYEGTSLDDIVTTTGLKKGSLYACFGNKEKLFRIALGNYAKKGPFYPFNRLKSPLKRLTSFYETLIRGAEDPKNQRKGCFVFNSSLEFGDKKDSLAAYVAEVGQKNEVFFFKLMEEANELGELSGKVSVEVAAGRAHATAFTIREMSKFKPNKPFLEDIANTLFESIGAKQRVFS
jgi:TetR/AcrR family transcriptional regulator, transcriptional repressor for nem operon